MSLSPRCGLIVLMVLAWSGPMSIRADEPAADWEGVTRRARAISERYGFEVVLVREPGESPGPSRSFEGTVYQPADLSTYLAFLPVLRECLGRLPDDLLRNAGLRRLILCGDLTCFREPQGGYLDWEKKTIFFSVKKLRGDESYRFIEYRRGFFHECYHVLDHKLHYNEKKHRTVDAAWESINRRNFLYSREGGARLKYDESDQVLAGFISTYSRESMQEDKAELFSFMLMRPDLIRKQGRSDPMLMAKVEKVKDDLFKLDPGVAGRFWYNNVFYYNLVIYPHIAVEK